MPRIRRKSKKEGVNTESSRKAKSSTVTGGPEHSKTPEKERLLQTELEQITSELESVQQHVLSLRHDCNWLQQEADQVRIESQEYMSYFDKKSSKRQTTVVTLSDQNLKQISELTEEKQCLLQQFIEEKQLLSDTILQKEHQLRKLVQQIDDMQEYKDLQQQQMNNIKELEHRAAAMRNHQSDIILQLKSNFLKEKRDCLAESQIKVEQMSRQANHEALVCLNEHTLKVKAHNSQLRHQLLLLIRNLQTLHQHKRHLQDQHQLLLLEREYASAMKLLRCKKQTIDKVVVRE